MRRPLLFLIIAPILLSFLSFSSYAQLANFTAGVTTADVSCYGANDGAANLTVSGGVSPYTYEWSNGATSQNLTGIGSGSYSVTVTDSRGASASACFTITEPKPIQLSFQSQSGCGSSSGAVNLTVTGGTGPYTYSWSNGATTEDLSGLSNGTYSVSVTDASGCIKSGSVFVAITNSLKAYLTKKDISCYKSNDGSLSVIVYDGSAPYKYKWSTGDTTASISGLSDGNYSVTITDAFGCTLTLQETIIRPALLITSLATTQNNCSGAHLDLSVSGGVTPYRYAWSNGVKTEDQYVAQSGTYSVLVSDKNGCRGYQSVYVSGLSVLSLSATSTSVTCLGGPNDGSVNLSVTGGTAPYTYAWSTGATTEDLTAVAAGTYIVKVTDATGCIKEHSVVVNPPKMFSYQILADQISCQGADDGSIAIMVYGGTSPYSYLWSTGETTVGISGLTPGTYYCDIKDAAGCTQRVTYSLEEPEQMSVTQAVTEDPCNGSSIDLSVSGGTGDYSYEWSDSTYTEDRTDLGDGTYTVIITDENGCQATETFFISGGNPMALSVATTANYCPGTNEATATVAITGGTKPLNISWSTGATTSTITDLYAGTYTVTVVDSNGCSKVAKAVITDPAPVVITFFKKEISCSGGNDGALYTKVSGGTSPYTYLWTTGATTTYITGLTAGIYGVSVTDAKGCETTSKTQLTAPPAFSASLATSSTKCTGTDIDLTVTGGVAPYSFLWSNGATTEDLYGVGDGTYSVSIKDARGCVITQSITVTSVPALQATIVPTYDCAGGSADLTVTGGSIPYTYQWSNGETIEDITGLSAGTYFVTVTDKRKCSVTASVSLNPPVEPLDAEVKSTLFNDGTGAADLTVSGGTAPYTYKWSHGPTTQDVTGLETGTYSVTITDSKGCTTIAKVAIEGQPLPLAATINCCEDISVCSGETGYIEIHFDGVGPYTFTYTDGSQTYTVTTTENPYYLAVSPTTVTTYKLVSVKNACSAGTVCGEATVGVNNCGASLGRNKSCDATQSCISTEVLSIEDTPDGCKRVSLRLHSNDACHNAVSHFTLAVPCGVIVSAESPSGDYQIVIGYDPTTGLEGIKYDNLSNFGQNGQYTLDVIYVVCPEGGVCLNEVCNPLMVYKMGTCLVYDNAVNNGGGNARIGTFDDEQAEVLSMETVTAHPNPFSNTTDLEMSLEEEGNVIISIISETGYEVFSTEINKVAEGSFTYSWNGKDSQGNDLPNGLYYCKVLVNNQVQVLKLSKLR